MACSCRGTTRPRRDFPKTPLPVECAAPPRGGGPIGSREYSRRVAYGSVEGGSKLTTFAGSSRCLASSSSRRSPSRRRPSISSSPPCRLPRSLSGRSSRLCRSQSSLLRLSCRPSWCSRPETPRAGHVQRLSAVLRGLALAAVHRQAAHARRSRSGVVARAGRRNLRPGRGRSGHLDRTSSSPGCAVALSLARNGSSSSSQAPGASWLSRRSTPSAVGSPVTCTTSSVTAWPG